VAAEARAVNLFKKICKYGECALHSEAGIRGALPVLVGELGQEREEVRTKMLVTHALHHMLYRFGTL
jgi:hypothetical protein